MAPLHLIPKDCVIPEGTVLEQGVILEPRVVLAGEGIVIRMNARVGAAAVIGEKVSIGQGACVRPGAVVLRSIPPNAIVEGNPAQVVGYVEGAVRGHPTKGAGLRHFDTRSFHDSQRPSRIPLEVGDSAVYLMRRFSDPRGALTVGEVPTELPFAPARFFTVFNVPSVELRGEHAHKQCEQFLICVHGSVRVLLDDGERRCEVTLDRPDLGVYMPAMIWGTQYRYSADAVLLVFASRPYEAEDYLRTYDDFLIQLERLNT
ncbi:MAG: WxcM-like domain-containing protein [Rhodobacteraceae bacterium]|nr:WxcM-like domain-containing protein [Paracoccaceae bacterium]